MVDEQMAFEYAIYMILGSYFPKTTCSNARLEEKMRVDLLVHRPEGTIEMRFVCPEYIVRVRGDYKKKNSSVECELWKKKGPQKTTPKVVAMQKEMCYSDITAC